MTTPETPDAATATRKSRPAWRRYLPVALLVLAMAAAYAGGAQRYLSLDAIAQHRDALKGAVEAHGVVAILLYGLAYVAAVALSLPGATLLTLLGGFLFGGILGGSIAVIAATIGAVGVFLVARSAFGESLQRKAGSALTKILAGFKDDAVSYMLFLRLVPAFPFWLVNLAAALGGVTLSAFAWTTFVGIMPGTFAFSVAGAGLDSVIAAQQSARAACEAAGRGGCTGGLDIKAILTPQLLVAFALLGCVALIPVIWRRIGARRKAKSGDIA